MYTYIHISGTRTEYHTSTHSTHIHTYVQLHTQNQWGQVACSLAWRSPLWRGPPLLGKPTSPGRLASGPHPNPRSTASRHSAEGRKWGHSRVCHPSSCCQPTQLERAGTEETRLEATVLCTQHQPCGAAGGWGDSPGHGPCPLHKPRRGDESASTQGHSVSTTHHSH